MSFSSSGVSSRVRSATFCFERRLAAFEQREFAIQLRALDLLAIFLQALHALLHHHQVAQDQLDLHVFEIAHRIHRAFLVRHGVALKKPQHVGQRVGYAHAGEIARIAQRLFRDGREIEILNRGVRDLGRLENFRQRVQPRVRHLGDARRAPPSIRRAWLRARRSES